MIYACKMMIYSVVFLGMGIKISRFLFYTMGNNIRARRRWRQRWRLEYVKIRFLRG